jgi:inositol oxygenase
MSDSTNPLASLDEWEDDVLRRYPNAIESATTDATGTENTTKSKAAFRDYAKEARPSVREFYRLNHQHQTFDFVSEKREQYLGKTRARMSIWEAMEYLNTLVDDSDPDIDLPQIEHLLQTAEAIRHDGKPRWFILAGLVHDLGKILCLWGEPQWAVVGDTFPVGCRYSERIIYYEAFRENPDWNNPTYQSELGIYQEHCGLDETIISWGHDEYMYHVAKDYLPEPALAMIRYHSCYPVHREGAYTYLMNQRDHEMMHWVREFNNYDLYTKRDERMNVDALRPFYESLIDEYFPKKIDW